MTIPNKDRVISPTNCRICHQRLPDAQLTPASQAFRERTGVTCRKCREWLQFTPAQKKRIAKERAAALRKKIRKAKRAAERAVRAEERRKRMEKEKRRCA